LAIDATIEVRKLTIIIIEVIPTIMGAMGVKSGFLVIQ
jgi:hypothetical protein